MKVKVINTRDETEYNLYRIQRNEVLKTYQGLIREILDGTDKVDVQRMCITEEIHIGDEVAYFNKRGLGEWGYIIAIHPVTTRGLLSYDEARQFSVTVIDHGFQEENIIQWGFWLLIGDEKK